MPKKRKSRKRNGRGATLGSDWRTRHLVTDQNPLYVRDEKAAEELRAFFRVRGRQDDRWRRALLRHGGPLRVRLA